MTEPSKAQVFTIDILIGVGFGLLISIALIFVKHNPLIAFAISIIYALIQIRSFTKLFRESLYVGIFGRFLFSGCFVCILGAMVWGIVFKGFDIGLKDQMIFIVIVSIAFMIPLIFSILKNFFPENSTYKMIR